MNISVVGVGYVGRALAQSLAKQHQVTVFDIDSKKTQGLGDDIRIASSLSLAAKESDYIIIAVPTDYDDASHQFNTASVDTVIAEILTENPTATIVIKSTVPVGYTRAKQLSYPEAALIFCPEFLRENSALEDAIHPTRIVVGYDKSNPCSTCKARQFAEIIRNLSGDKDVPILLVGMDEAEAIKLFANTYLALRVSYFNELDTYAMLRGLNSADIIKGVCLDPRIGEGYNNPSFGYGGYCLPKDTKQLLHNFDAVPQNLIEATIHSNKTRKEAIAQEIVHRVKTLNNPVIGIYRLSMKLGSDNYRQSAILDILPLLRMAGLTVQIYEPLVKEDRFLDAPVVHDRKEFLESSSIIVANRIDENLKP